MNACTPSAKAAFTKTSTQILLKILALFA